MLDCNAGSYTVDPDFTYRFDYRGKDFETGQWSFFTGVTRLAFPDEVPLRGLLNTSFVGEGKFKFCDSYTWKLRVFFLPYLLRPLLN